jgi:hypothetical protein
VRITTAELHQILGQLKDFQRRTVDYVFKRMYLDDPPARRFLVADEVGLGKTMVARGLIARTLHHLADRVDRIDVVYICSNASIAEQNVNRLNVLGLDHIAVATRLTMLPVQLGQLSANRVNFVSFTPGTTFDLKSRGGKKEERAVLFRMLSELFPHWRAALFNMLRCTAGRDGWKWTVEQSRDPIDAGLAARFAARVREDAGLLSGLEEACQRFSSSGAEVSSSDSELRYQVIGELRHLLARVCVDALEPDLVILDEFQRFKDILHGETDAAELARSLLNYQSEHGDSVRVLLLSATPYRMLSLNHEGEEDHHTDFLHTLSFLFENPAAVEDAEAALREYRMALYGVGEQEEQALSAAKDWAEECLRSVMVRTERVSFTEQQDSMVAEPRTTAPLAAQDLTQAVVADRVASAVGARDTIEYWNSAPYLLNFMKGYEFKAKLDVLHDRPPEELLDALRTHRGDVLRRSQFERYRELDPGNARLRFLMRDTVDAGQWKLLWMPPSLPYMEPGGAYAELPSTTKSLVFSSWNVVPDAIAALCSYEAERRMLGDGDIPPYHELYRKRRPLLRFAAAGAEQRLTGMPALALLYPCVTLARIGDPLALATRSGRRVSGEEARAAVREELQRRLDEVVLRHGTMDGAEDQRWYWASLALLDGPHASDLVRWTGATDGWLSVGAGHEEDPESRFAQHISHFREAFSGHLDLGRPPDDLLDVLTEFALGSPAICALRALSRLDLQLSHAEMLQGAARIAGGFRTLFNLPETMGLLRGEDEGAYWRLVLSHCIEGNLQAVLDEYTHVLRESLGLIDQPGNVIVDRISVEVAEALSLRTAALKMDEVRVRKNSHRMQIREFRLRSRFALRFGDARSDEESALHRVGTVRQAFNSPFRPFILASTSIGQEGLDFHPYCHAIYHWNLPSNPVDLEQREGRVHRYKGHAVRKNLTHRFSWEEIQTEFTGCRDPWTALFDLAVRERAPDASDLIPYWIYEGGPTRIERRVPILPFSREQHQLRRLKDRLAVYRLVFGQPRQEDLLAHLERRRAAGHIQMGKNHWGISLMPPLVDLEESGPATPQTAREAIGSTGNGFLDGATSISRRRRSPDFNLTAPPSTEYRGEHRPALADLRDHFLGDMKINTSPADAREFEAILDDLISWSLQRPELMRLSERFYAQAVISFERVPDGAVLWSAYPQHNGRTKLSLLPGSMSTLAEPLRSEVRAELHDLTRGELNEQGTLQIRFRFLTELAVRQRVKSIMERLLHEHSGSSPEGPSVLPYPTT